MKINLVELDHQKEAISSILSNMPDIAENSDTYSNPLLENAYDERKFIDIKMETGTGKTYVYTRAMYELHQKYGLFKFVIVVPSLAIKEGTKNFIISDYAKQHFSKFFPNKRIDLQLINAGDFSTKKGKRKNFPSSIIQFCEATQNEKNNIQCLLISDKGFLDSSKSALFKNDYDQTLWGGSNCPIEAIKNTRPILFIDEPHRIKRENSTYKNIIEKIQPQMIVRFGATFPEISIGSGRNKITRKDYYQDVPQFDLGAIEAFNRDLVKGVSVQFPQISDEALNLYTVKSVSAKKLVLSQGNREWEIDVGEDLSSVGSGFDGDITYDGNKKLSNELELEVGMKIAEGVFSNSYQEILIQQALDSHFETEIANFHRDDYKIKTIALFFIDSISSYRGGWLEQTFDKLLLNKLNQLLKEYTSGDYHDYLLATKNNIANSRGGYFAKDWGEPDESAIKEEINDILHKERTLSFKKENGEWNIRRFFFSKWTLREGWDNPNVFTICKLRSSGSETSKIQEVGRGLRLPVDEQGNRLADNDWKLNFIIGWDEKDFAKKLVGEINSDSKIKLDKEKLTEEMIQFICANKNIDEESLLETLDNENVIKRNNDFKENGYEKLLELYPEILQIGLKKGKVVSPDLPKKPKIKLRVKNWEKIESFWKEVSKRYMIIFENIDEKELYNIFKDILNTDNVFNDNENITIVTQSTQKNKFENVINTTESYQEVKNIGNLNKYSYNEFVTKLAKNTAIPIQIIHNCLWEKLLEFSQSETKEQINSKLNQKTLLKIEDLWKEKFAEIFASKYKYDALNFTVNTSIMKNGSFIKEFEQGLIGVNLANDVNDDERNLYEKPIAYDSDIEHEVEKILPPSKIKVFGKIPRRAIKVPTYTGGTTTPDFIYTTEKDGKVDLTLLIETKSNDIRDSEKRAVKAQEKLFSKISNIQWELVKDSDEVKEILQKL